jgi:hypothetical protein
LRNASERKDIRRAEKFAAETARARIEFVVAAMSTIQGRAWFHDLLVFCNVFDGSFSGDALLEAFNKGQRNVGLNIYSDIVGNCPDSFVQMMKEANIKEIVNDRSTEYSDDADDGSGSSEDADG